MASAAGGIPPDKAVCKDARDTASETVADAEMIGVGVIVPVIAVVVAEAAAVLIIGSVAGIQGMNVAQGIAGGAQMDTDEDLCNAHIGQRVVVALEQNTDGIGFARADDVDTGDICVGGAGVGTALDVDADACMLDRNITHDGFASAVDGNAACPVCTVDDAAGEGIVGADRIDIICRMRSTETDDGFLGGPIL